MTRADAPPVHLVAAGTEGHGVTVLARQIARQVRAPVVEVGPVNTAFAPGLPGRVHVHVTDRLFGDTPAEAAARLGRCAQGREVTVTFHDVPQPTDGRGFARRAEAYRAIAREARAWATNSETERALLHHHCGLTGGQVVHLPVLVGTGRPQAHLVAPRIYEATVGVFGWIYPGKGHLDALEAAALVGDDPDRRPSVVALGRVARGHDDLLDDLRRRADLLGVRLRHTGWIDDEEVVRRLRSTTVAVSAHGNVSASGSINSWLAAGHRPLVRDGAYAREMAGLRPGTLELYDGRGGAAELARRLRRRLERPSANAWHGMDLRPTLDDVGARYRAWWGEVGAWARETA